MSSTQLRRSKVIRGHALALGMLLFLPVLVLAQAPIWSWKTETVDISAKFTSLTADSQGNVHLAYFADQQEVKGVKYAFRAASQSKWYTMLVKPTGEAVTGIVLDSDGNPHICYTNGAVYYVEFDGKRWSSQEIAPNSGTRSYECSVAVAKDGTPYVSWYHEFTPTHTLYGHFKYAVLQDGRWLARTVDFDNQTGKWNSMVLDAQGYPRISYSSWDKGAMKYAYWDGKQWNIRIVASGETDPKSGAAHGLGSSLVLTPDGMAHISYVALVKGMTGDAALMYASQSAGKWITEKVDSTLSTESWQGVRTSLALDRDGFPHITYEDGGALKHAYWNGNRWQVQMIAPGGADPYYRNSAIAVSPDNKLFLSYRDPDDGSLKVAVGELVAAQKRN